MSKKKIIISVIVCVILIAGITTTILLLNNKKEEPKETLLLNDNLNVEINSEVKLLSFVSKDNKVKILSDDVIIDTSTLGEKDITIKYLDKDKEEEFTFKIKVIDTQAPTIEYKKELSTQEGTEIDLLKDVKVEDNSKEELEVKVEGEYNFNKVGTYNLKYVTEDSSKNKTEEEFTLTITEKPKQVVNNQSKQNNNTNRNNQTSNNNQSQNTQQEQPKDSCSSESIDLIGGSWYISRTEAQNALDNWKNKHPECSNINTNIKEIKYVIVDDLPRHITDEYPDGSYEYISQQYNEKVISLYQSHYRNLGQYGMFYLYTINAYRY